MKTNYSLSQSLIAASTSSAVDLIISFKAEKTGEKQRRRPLNLSIVIDRSGSMAGTSLRYAIQAAQALVEHLTAEDILSVVIYDDNAETILAPQPVEDKAAISSLIGKIQAGGCTNLSGGWLLGCDHVKSKQSAERINRVLLLTDGQANDGITDPTKLINTAKKQAEQGVVTTTLGFGTGFNEDLLIGMANAANGNFYFIQSPDDAADVFRIELESLLSVVAQNLTVTLQPENVNITGILNNYRSQAVGNNLEVFVGDVYEVEPKQLAIELTIQPQAQLGLINLLTVAYKYHAVVDDIIQQFTEQIPINITVIPAEEASTVQQDTGVVEQASKLRIAKVKDEAIALADQGDYNGASVKLRKTVEDLKLKALHESFEVAEEMEQLEHYAQRLETRRFDTNSRKEMRDQSYQARARNRDDLKLRGIASSSANRLEAVSSFDTGVLVKCEKESGKLRIRVISEGFNPEFNVQFPRDIRQEGATYIVEEVTPSANGTFYRASGNIRLLVQPGQERAANSFVDNTYTARAPKRQKLNAPKTAADLESVDTIGDGVLVQCVKEGSKLRARVVSDGFNPNYNIRFPRDIREVGVLYVVDEVEEASNGGSYVAYGKIRRLVQ